jgi:hypothetical protein
MTDLHSLLRPPNIYLIIAVIQLSWGVFFTCTGKAKAPYAPSVYRAREFRVSRSDYDRRAPKPANANPPIGVLGVAIQETGVRQRAWLKF